MDLVHLLTDFTQFVDLWMDVAVALPFVAVPALILLLFSKL